MDRPWHSRVRQKDARAACFVETTARRGANVTSNTSQRPFCIRWLGSRQMKRAPDGTRENFGGRSLNEPGRCKRAQIAPISGGQTHFVAPTEPDSHLSCALKSPAQHRRRGHPRKTTYLGSAARWVHKNQTSLLARICAALRSDKHANWSAALWPAFTMDFFAANYGL